MPEVLVNPYCTLDALKSELKLDKNDASKDDDLILAINTASRWVDDYKGMTFYQQDKTVTPMTFNAMSLDVVGVSIFPRTRIRSLATVEEEGAVLVEGEDYIWNEREVRRVTCDWEIPSDQPVKLYGMFGYQQTNAEGEYAATEVPADLPANIRFSTLLVAAAISGHSRKNVVTFDGNVQTVNDRDIPDIVFQMLGRRGPILT